MTRSIFPGSRIEIVQELRERVRSLEEADRSAAQAAVSSGSAVLDRLLPHGGFRRGTLIEGLSAEEGSGAGTLAFLAAQEACTEGGALVVMDRRRQFYPPAASALGIDLSKLVVVRPESERDELWALGHVLRCQAVAAVWEPVEKLDGRTFRRLQLAAESGGSLGLLLRPASARGQPTWADVQLLVSPRTSQGGRRVQVEVVRCRGGTGGAAVELEIDETTATIRKADTPHETHPLPLAARLAHPAPYGRSTGA